MRLSDEQIIKIFWEGDDCPLREAAVKCVRRCLALAALPDAPSDYSDRERRGFEVSQPGELPK